MTNDDLLVICITVRTFLEPKWLQAHNSWGDHPEMPSKHMCRYTSIFLKHVLNSTSQSWQLVAGRPLERKHDGTRKGKFGFRTPDGLFFDHCWLQAEDVIVDLTADRFRAQKIIITTVGDSRSSQNLTESDLQEDISRLSRRPSQWLNQWQNEHHSTSFFQK